MLYPLKFEPVYKDYIWGGRNLEKLGKVLPQGIVAESWEVSCHPDGTSIIANGELKGCSLPDYLAGFGRRAFGFALSEAFTKRFPLLVKLIDANQTLSVQVHPDDAYAMANENGESGKNEMWYIVSAKPGATLIYDLIPGTTRNGFEKALREEKLENCLKHIEVSEGDVINIPAGCIHAIGSGIVLAEIQQNSNATYRVYDYGRLDAGGKKRQLHIEKALDVIDFNHAGRKEKYRGLEVEMPGGLKKQYLAATTYYAAERYSLDGNITEIADGSRFYIYTFLEGEGSISTGSHCISVKCGESVFVPADLGSFGITGRLKAIKAYIPDLESCVISPLIQAGYKKQDILTGVAGLETTAYVWN